MSRKNGFLPIFFVMTFSVNGIKQEKEQKYNVEMLVCVDAPLLARKILEQTNILILSIKEFPADKTTFGDIYFTISLNFQDIDIVTKYTDIQEAAKFFTFIGFDIQHINSFSKPVSQKEMDTIVSAAKKEAEKKKEEIRKQIADQEEKERKVYEDEKLVSAKKIVDTVFQKVEECTKRAGGLVGIQDSKKIKSLVEELKKLRMGTNFEKIRDTIQELFTMMEHINDDYYSSIQDVNDTISDESLVTNVDVQRELERMENVKLLKALHAKISLKNQDYATFGPSAIYRKFLQKDILMKFSDVSGILRSLYDITELVMLVVVSLLGVYTLANEIYLFSVNQFGLSYMLMSVGLRGMVIFAARYFRNKNIGRLLLIIVVAILLHYVLMRAVTTNFAL